MQIVNDIKLVTYLKSKAADVLLDGRAIMKLLSFSEDDIRSGNLHSEEDVFSSVEELLSK